MYFLLSALAQASAIAIIAIALALFLRATGVVILEATIFGTALALAVVTGISRQSAAAPRGGWFLLSAILALLLTVSLLAFYRVCRSARGGDATTLMMSFALMNVLALTMSKLTDGKSVNVGADFLGNPLGVSLLGWGVILAFHIASRRGSSLSAVKLARDNDALLTTFGLSGNRIRITTTLLACVFLALGSLLFIIEQENFSASKYELYLIPAFSVAISRKRLNALSIGATSLGLVVTERLLEFFGPPLLQRVYQSIILVVLALCAPPIAELYRRLKYQSEIA